MSLLISKDVFIKGCQVQPPFLFVITLNFCLYRSGCKFFFLVFFFLEVFIGRNEHRIVLSDTDMQTNNTETWKSVN